MSCLFIGKLNKRLTNSGKYQICLTDEETQTLFAGQEPIPIGCGTYACAYEDPSDDSRVVKLTHDADDVISTILASQYGEPHVAQLFGMYKLTNPGIMEHSGEEVPVYAMRVEKLYPFPENQKRFVARLLQPIVRFALWRHNFGIEQHMTPEQLKASMLSECPPRGREFVSEFLDTISRFDFNGIRFRDIHVGNLGLDKDNDWKILDLGMSSPDLSAAPDVEFED